MNELLDNLESDIGILSSEPFEDLHDSIIFSIGLILSAITNSTNNKVVINFPVENSDFVNWISVAVTLELMRIDYFNNNSDEIDYIKFQKLLINNKAVVEFLAKPSNNKIRVQTKDTILTIANSQISSIQLIDTDRALSLYDNLYNILLEKQETALDNLLDIDSKGDYANFHSTIVFYSSIKNATHFIEEEILGEKIKNLFLWGKLTPDGSVKQITSSQFLNARATAIITSEFSYIRKLIRKGTHNVQAVIVKDLELTKNSFTDLDDLEEFNLPVIAFSSNSSIDLINDYLYRDFKVFNWTQKELLDCREGHNKPHIFTKEIRKFINREVLIERCSWPLLEDSILNLFKLKKILNLENLFINNNYWSLYKILDEISKIILMPTSNWFDHKIEELDALKADFDSHAMYIQKDHQVCVNEIIEQIKSLLDELIGGKNQKLDIIKKKIIDQSGFYPKGIIAKDSYHKENSLDGIKIDENQNDWLRYSKIFSHRELLNKHPDSISLKIIIISGWLGQSKMETLFTLNRKIYLIYFPFEEDWHNHFYSKWMQSRELSTDYKEISDIMGYQIDDTINYQEKLLDKKEDETSDSDDWNIQEFELDLSKSFYGKFDSDSRNNDVSATPVKYVNGMVSFFTDTYKIMKATDYFNLEKEGETSDIKSVKINELNPSDYIIIGESDRDILREVTDNTLVEQGHSNIVDSYKLWYRALIKYQNENNLSIVELTKKCAEFGLTKTVTTMRNWTAGRTIGPRNTEEDIASIISLTGNEEIKGKFDDIIDSIKHVKSARMQVSMNLHNIFRKEIQNLLDEELPLDSYYELDIDGFGTAIIIQIDEIESETIKRDYGIVNRILD